MSKIKGPRSLSVLISEQVSFDQKVWYERLNLVNKAKRFCQRCAGNFYFWLTVAAFTVAEPILCSNFPVGVAFYSQVAVLAVSSVLYVIQLVGTASREWDKIVLIQAMSSASNLLTVQDFTPLKILIFFTAEGEYILEFCCLLGGWLTIFIRPGLAILRCFRVFRLLWFYEVIVFKTTIERVFNPIFGEEFVVRCFKVMRFAIKALTALGNEMFRLTNATRGGLLLMMMLFYSALVLGTCIWVETGGDSAECNTRSHCTYTLMRLTFFDGDSFNFIYSLTSNHKFLFFVCIMYMCLTSFGILNGLVGIFGTAFAAASDEAFHDKEEGSVSSNSSGDDGNDEAGEGGDDEEGGEEDVGQRQLRSRRLASLVFRSFKNLNPDDDSVGSGAAAAILSDAGSRRNSSASAAPPNHRPFSTPANLSNPNELPTGQKVISPREGDNYGNINVLSDDEDGGVGGGGDISDSDGDREAPPTVAPHSGGGVVGDENIRTQYDKLAPADKAAMQKALMGKLGGKSAFALQELKKATEQQGHGGNSSSRPGLLSKRPFGSNTSATSRYAADTSKVLPLENTVSSTSPTTAAAAAVASVGDTDDAAGVPGAPTHAASPSAPTLSKVIKRHAAEAPAAGMFALTRNAKSNKSLVHHNHNPFAPKQHQSSHHHNHHHHNNGTGSGAHGVNGSAELKALTVNVQTLTRTVEVQNDMILALYVQILALKQQQQSSDGGDSNHRSGTQQKGTEITFPVLTPSPHIAGTIARLNEAANRHSPGNHYQQQLSGVQGKISTTVHLSDADTASTTTLLSPTPPAAAPGGGCGGGGDQANADTSNSSNMLE